jgi:dTDP-4-dehydrorhamnose reductase
MTWLILGGTGQLGLALSRQLKTEGIPYLASSSINLDITDEQDMRGKINQWRPSVIVNCAAWTDVEGAENNEVGAFRVNAIGAENAAIAARAIGAKFIHISTDYVFSGESTSAWKINDKTNPTSAYGRTKLAGEEKVLSAYAENTLIFRTAWLYSPWKRNFVKAILRLASEDYKQIPVVNDQMGQPTSAIDLATRIIEIASSRINSGIFHATNSGSATWFDFAAEIMTINGDDLSRLKPIFTSELKQKARRPKFSVLDHSNWAKCGFKPMRDWKSALRNTLSLFEVEARTGLRDA